MTRTTPDDSQGISRLAALAGHRHRHHHRCRSRTVGARRLPQPRSVCRQLHYRLRRAQARQPASLTRRPSHLGEFYHRQSAVSSRIPPTGWRWFHRWHPGVGLPSFGTGESGFISMNRENQGRKEAADVAITTEVRLVLTEKDAGSSHTVRAREQISVSLTEIAGTAYYWEWQTPPQLVEKSNVFIPDNPGAAGTSG